jgi:hypothetical protein
MNTSTLRDHKLQEDEYRKYLLTLHEWRILRLMTGSYKSLSELCSFLIQNERNVAVKLISLSWYSAFLDYWSWKPQNFTISKQIRLTWPKFITRKDHWIAADTSITFRVVLERVMVWDEECSKVIGPDNSQECAVVLKELHITLKRVICEFPFLG